jgi:hypothetical protein
MQLVKLFDEKHLLGLLKADSMGLIRACFDIGAIKKLVQCHDILDLTLEVQERFPKKFPEPPECDQDALLYLKQITQEINVWHGKEVPRPHFDLFDINVRKLLRVFRVPREEYSYDKPSPIEYQTQIDVSVPNLLWLDVGHGRPPTKK